VSLFYAAAWAIHCPLSKHLDKSGFRPAFKTWIKVCHTLSVLV
jgi:hypothetical protein